MKYYPSFKTIARVLRELSDMEHVCKLDQILIKIVDVKMSSLPIHTSFISNLRRNGPTLTPVLPSPTQCYPLSTYWDSLS